MGDLALFLFLLSIPTQLGKHFWPEWSLVGGIRVDYLSPTIYLTDIFWGLWVVGKFSIRSKFFSFKNIILLLLVLVNVIVAENGWVAAYRWLRIFQWIVTVDLIRKERLKVAGYLKWIVPMWVVVESLLGVAQVIKGGSLQGVWYWLGERRFSLTTIGIAQMRMFGEGMIRAYGTFSHPNSLAGFLIVALWWWGRIRKKNWFYWMVWWCGVVGIVLSGSRWVWAVAILIFGLKLLFFNRNQSLRRNAGFATVVGGVVLLTLGIVSYDYQLRDFWGGWDSESLMKRWSLVVATFEEIRSSPLFGVGVGNLVIKMPWLQPVHNIFLLAWGELGTIGIIGSGMVMGGYLRFLKKKENWILLGLVAATGVMDHYWLTLPQNSWLLGVIIGII